MWLLTFPRQVAFALLLNAAFPWHDFIMDQREKPMLENVREMINVRCVTRAFDKYSSIRRVCRNQCNGALNFTSIPSAAWLEHGSRSFFPTVGLSAALVHN